ncbi:MAG: hypothetical protein ACXV75_12805, partial [Candidatus Angelobacter sp.]
MLLLAAASLHADQVPPSPVSDAVFLWLAGGISNARVERLIQTQNAQKQNAQTPSQTRALSCQSTSQCTRALQKAGAESELIQSLVGKRSDRKPAADSSCICSSPAAQVAALAHDKNFDAAENKVRTLLQDDAGNDANHALLNFVLGTILRREDRFDEALDAFTESSRLLPGFPETHSQLSYLFYRTDDPEAALAEARTALS